MLIGALVLGLVAKALFAAFLNFVAAANLGCTICENPTASTVSSLSALERDCYPNVPGGLGIVAGILGALCMGLHLYVASTNGRPGGAPGGGLPVSMRQQQPQYQMSPMAPTPEQNRMAYLRQEIAQQQQQAPQQMYNSPMGHQGYPQQQMQQPMQGYGQQQQRW